MFVKKFYLQGLNEFKATNTKVCARHPKAGNPKCKALSEVFGSHVKMRLEHILCLIISGLVLRSETLKKDKKKELGNY